jgi:hypothetical protein
MRYNSKRHGAVGRQKLSARPLWKLNGGLGVSPQKKKEEMIMKHGWCKIWQELYYVCF